MTQRTQMPCILHMPTLYKAAQHMPPPPKQSICLHRSMLGSRALLMMPTHSVV